MRCITLLVLSLCGPAISLAATINVPADQPTIQAGIFAAKHGDIVLVAPGTYIEKINFLGKAILVTSSNGAAVTVIDGYQVGNVVTFNTNEGSGSVLQGFTVTNGRGIQINNASPEIRENIIRDNHSNNQGGGIRCLQGGATIVDNIIEDNSAVVFGGGIFCEDAQVTIEENTVTGNWTTDKYGDGGGICCLYSHGTIKNNHIAENWTQGSYADGGGICCFKGSVDITANTISLNKSGSHAEGGGIYFLDAAGILAENSICQNASGGDGGGLYLNADITASKNTISFNSSEGWGGGIYIDEYCSPTILNNQLSRNTAPRGGGMACRNSGSATIPTLIEDNLIEGNLADFGGGGIDVWEGWITISRNTITNNVSNDMGGGIFDTGECYDLTIRYNTISHNTAGWGGGGIYSYYNEYGYAPTILSNMIFGNTALHNGGGISVKYAVVYGNTIYGNAAGDGGGGIYLYQGFVINTILWQNHAPTGPEMYLKGSSSVQISHSDVEGGQSSIHLDPGATLHWGAGMLEADPQFADPVEEDFHLFFTSPCKDSGDNTVPKITDEDFEGDPRVTDSVVDMGADEFHRHLYYTGNAAPGAEVAVKMVGSPGTAQVALVLGFDVFDPPLPGAYGDWYIKPPMILLAGLPPLPAEGVAVLPGTLPSAPPGPYTIYLQAMIGYELTNLSAMAVE